MRWRNPTLLFRCYSRKHFHDLKRASVCSWRSLCFGRFLRWTHLYHDRPARTPLLIEKLHQLVCCVLITALLFRNLALLLRRSSRKHFHDPKRPSVCSWHFVRFGLRTFAAAADGSGQLLLNGQAVKLKGFNRHD